MAAYHTIYLKWYLNVFLSVCSADIINEASYLLPNHHIVRNDEKSIKYIFLIH